MLKIKLISALKFLAIGVIALYACYDFFLKKVDDKQLAEMTDCQRRDMLTRLPLVGGRPIQKDLYVSRFACRNASSKNSY